MTSDKPVAVFGSHLGTFIPEGFGFADHIVEQLPPTSAWGREFVTMPLATRFAGDTFRFLAATDGTVIRVNGVQVATLNRGEYHERVITLASQIISNHPILVAQYSNSSQFDGVTSDPFMLYIPPLSSSWPITPLRRPRRASPSTTSTSSRPRPPSAT